MSGPKRNPDKLNTIGIVVVGVCGAVLVYVTIVALQAFYMNDTSELQTMKDYGGQDVTAKGRRADELRFITEPASNGATGTYRINITDAMKLTVEEAKKDPSHLIPMLPPSTKTSIEPKYGRGKSVDPNAPGGTNPTPMPEGAQGGATAPQTPTGAGAGAPNPVPGAGGGPAPGGATTPTQPKAPTPAAPTPAPAQPKAATPAPAQPKAAPAQPKAAPAQPKAAPAPAQPKPTGALPEGLAPPKTP